jgi:hypothetical protein
MPSLDYNAATAAGYSDKEINDFASSKGVQLTNAPKQYNEGAFEGAIDKTGAFDIPLLGGVARALTHPLLQGAETVAQGGAEGLMGASEALGLTKGGVKAPQFVSPQMQGQLNQRTQAGTEGFTNPDQTTQGLATTGVKQAAGVASYMPGLYGSIPGLAAAGGLSSFGNTQGDDLGTTVKNTAIGTILGPILGKLGEKALPVLVGGIKKTTSLLPDALQKSLDNKAIEMDNLEINKLGDTVGHDKLQLASQLGITPEMSPGQISNKLDTLLTAKGQEKNDILSKEYGSVTPAQIKEAILRAPKQVASALTDKVDLKEFASRIDDFLKQNILDEAGVKLPEGGAPLTSEELAKGNAPGKMSFDQPGSNPTPPLAKKTAAQQKAFLKGPFDATHPNIKMNIAGAAQEGTGKTSLGIPDSPILGSTGDLSTMSPGQTEDFMNNQTPVDLKTADSIKQRFQDAFKKNGATDDPMLKQAYHNIQQLIEEQSGHPAGVKRVNAEYNSLREMKEVADKAHANPPASVRNFEDSKNKLQSSSLDNSLAPAAAAATGMSIMGGLGGAGGGYAIWRLLNTVMKDPKLAQKLVNGINLPKEAMNTGIGKGAQSIGKAAEPALSSLLKQLGVRLPGNILH